MVKVYNILEAVNPSHFKIECLKDRRLRKLTRRHNPDDSIFINTAVNILICDVILRRDLRK